MFTDEFSTDFELEPGDAPRVEPDTEPTDDGPPWISHGTVHLGRKPNH